MKYFFFCFFILIYCNSFSQKTVGLAYEKTSLDSILMSVEKKYNIKFSYNAKITKNKKINFSEENNLEATLQQIQSKTSLLFQKVNERYYIIRAKNNKKRIFVCGYLVDRNTKKPIPEAFVKNTAQSESSISNDDGYFQLFLSKPTDSIHIQLLGYKNKRFIAEELKNKDCIKIPLTEDDVQLDEVLITEYLTSGISRQGANSAININTSKLGILPRLVEPDVLQTLQFLPGVQSPTETASALHIRGGTPDHNLILWDDIKMYSTGHFFDLLSIFNPYITENIKLSRSSTHSKYESRISGVVDIESKNEIPKGFGFGFGFNMTSADVFIETPISKNFGIVVSGRRAFTDFIETPAFRSYSDRAFQSINFFIDNQETDQETIENENIFYFTDFTLKAILDVSEDDKLTLSSIFTNNDLDYTLNIKNIQGFNEPFDENQTDNLKYVNKGANIRWNRKWNSKFNHTANVYFSRYDFTYTGFRESIAVNEDLQFFENNIEEENTIRDVGASIHTDWKINPKHLFTTGYNFSTNNVTYIANYSADNISADQSSNNITHAIFGEYVYNLNKKFNIGAGIRGNYFSIVDKTYWEPRINLDINLHKNFLAKASAERKNQVISQISNFLPDDFNLDNQIWLLADSEFVSILSSDQVSGGFTFNRSNWYIDIEGYHKSIEGLTSFANGFNGVLNLENGKSEVLGLDILIKKRIQDYRTWIGYSYTDQDFKFENTNNGNSFPGNFDIKHSLSWIHSYQWKRLELSLGWTIRTGRPFTPANGITDTGGVFSIDYDEINSDRLNTYHRLDFSGSYKLNLSKKDTWRGKIGFSLFNIYNQNNTLNRTFNIKSNNGANLLQVVNTFSAGITPNLSLRIDF